MIGAAVALPFSAAEAADAEVARHIAGTGFRISSAMRARPFLCRSLEAAGARLTDLPWMLIASGSGEAHGGRDPTRRAAVFTDDDVPVERLIAGLLIGKDG